MEDNPGEGNSGRGGNEASCAPDCDSGVTAWEVLVLEDTVETAVDPEYMRSMVGRSARPKSVERKSDGRSGGLPWNKYGL